MDSVVANNGFILGIVSEGSADATSAYAYSIMAGWGLEGTHLSGSFATFGVPQSPWDVEVDLNTMVITSM